MEVQAVPVSRRAVDPIDFELDAGRVLPVVERPFANESEVHYVDGEPVSVR